MNTKCIKDNKKLAADIPSASFFSVFQCNADHRMFITLS